MTPVAARKTASAAVTAIPAVPAHAAAVPAVTAIAACEDPGTASAAVTTIGACETAAVAGLTPGAPIPARTTIRAIRAVAPGFPGAMAGRACLHPGRTAFRHLHARLQGVCATG